MERGALISDRLADRRAGGSSASTGSQPDAESARRAARDLWSAPRGRDLLAGVAILSVLVAILFALRHEAPPAHPVDAPEPFALKSATPLPPPPPPWGEVPVVRSVSDLPEDLVRPIAEGLAQARARLERCVAQERRRAGTAPEPSRAAAQVEVVLRLSGRAGAVHVDGLEVTSAGAAPEVVSCARRLLDGEILATRVGVAGRRQRLALALPP